jgi:hypothetical protein
MRVASKRPSKHVDGASARAFRVARNLHLSPRVMPSANRALLASSLLLCAVACAAIALLTIASSATEQLARLPVLASSSSISALEARVEADSKAAAAKDAGAKSLQAQLIKYAVVSSPALVDRLHQSENCILCFLC